MDADLRRQFDKGQSGKQRNSKDILFINKDRST